MSCGAGLAAASHSHVTASANWCAAKAWRPIIKRARASIIEAHAVRRSDEARPRGVATNGQRRDAMHVGRDHFARVADAVAVFVAPERQTAEFAASQFTVAIVIERSQGFEAIAPEHAPGALADQVEA